MELIPDVTTTDVERLRPAVAVLPVGSHEQHGSRLPLTTDTIVAGAIASKIAAEHNVLLLPPVTISCSHEHAAWAGTVSISHQTLSAIVTDVAASLASQGIDRLVLVNGHGGNYVLSNVVQSANAAKAATMTLFPTRADWDRARRDAGLQSTASEDMHAGEIEVSILAHVWPQAIRVQSTDGDHLVEDRSMLLVHGMAGYTTTGVIGLPSAGTAAKGKAVLDSLAGSFALHLDALGLSGVARKAPTASEQESR